MKTPTICATQQMPPPTTESEVKKQDGMQSVQTGQEPSKPHGISASLGQWAYDHRDAARSSKGELFTRTMLSGALAWIPTVTSFAFTRAAWQKYESHAAKHSGSLLTKLGRPLLSADYPTGRLVGFIFGGWFTFRTATRLYDRAYDRLFAAKSPEKAAEEVRAMPGNAVKDFKEILPGGLAEVAVGAPVLAGVKAALVPKANFIAVEKGQWAQAKKGYVNDWIATGLAYSAFTEWCDHVYPKVSHDKDSQDYYRKLQGRKPEEKIPDDQKNFGFFTNDGVGRIVFRTTASVLLGFSAYFAAQRAVKAAVGLPTNLEPTLKGITRNFAKDYAAWVPFTLFMGIAHVYKTKYDELFQKLEAKSAAKAPEPH